MSLCRYFGLSDRNGRWLPLRSVSSANGAFRFGFCAICSCFSNRHLLADLRSEETAKEMHSLGIMFLRQHVVLNRLSLAKRRRWWILRPKVHGWHEQLRRVARYRANQRYVHNYVDEDAMGWLRRISAFGSTRRFEANALMRSGIRLRGTILKWRKILRHQLRK